jgi:hypothetical protein
MVIGAFIRFPYETIKMSARSRKLIPYIESLYNTQGRTSREALQDFIISLDDPELGGVGLDTNVAAKIAKHYNTQVELRDQSLRDPMFTVKNPKMLPVNLIKQQREYSYVVKATYTNQGGEQVEQFITLQDDVPFDEIGFEALEQSLLDQGGREERYAVRASGTQPSFEVVSANRKNPTL